MARSVPLGETSVSLQPYMPWLLAALAVSLLGVVGGAMRWQMWLPAAGLFTFVASLAAVAVRVNAHHWAPQAGIGARLSAMQRNARLLAITYSWGALAMALSYATRLTGLRWQHGWQYALAMALIAWLCFFYAIQIWRSRGQPVRQALLEAIGIPLAILQLALGVGGLGFILATGKLLSRRSDWVANQIFTAGAVTVILLSLVALAVDRRIKHAEAMA